MKITLISFDNWGLNKHIATTLEQRGHEVHHIDFHSFSYQYPNVLHKVYNFFLKTFFKKNIKNIYYGQEIIKKLNSFDQKQDIILTIKGDFIDPKYLRELKQFTSKSIGYFNDNTYRCPKIKRAIPCFDEVYSFEKEDCKTYGLHFAPNWIYSQKPETKPEFKYDIFNISSKDKRLTTLLKIAKDLKSKNIRYKFMVLDKDTSAQSEDIEYFHTKIPLEEMTQLIAASKTLLDINRHGQKGLTFRVFESLGLEKKLITTNPEITSYDFYNPNNILVIDEENPNVPVEFFSNEYEKLPEALYYKYTLEGWVDQVVFGKTL
ncbi:hypothetical protein EZL74_08270 [Flavobacterium silvisoli]|uniref:Glycosyltransferase family 1 protein n=1 Tax=Flavobacterium silvisoli TaxID=2529433 RepID=A0A4Q9YYM2_9FLAO|nr:hypothetical protein [Flavobacterium silvisoli]TBX68777.1 hypothetical protein EZL74_08270 [Flavobacterium silvisoli]